MLRGPGRPRLRQERQALGLHGHRASDLRARAVGIEEVNENNLVILSSGPPAGTEVVTVGAIELWGRTSKSPVSTEEAPMRTIVKASSGFRWIVLFLAGASILALGFSFNSPRRRSTSSQSSLRRRSRSKPLHSATHRPRSRS